MFNVPRPHDSPDARRPKPKISHPKYRARKPSSTLSFIETFAPSIDGANVSMKLNVELGLRARYFGWEILGFGRRASGESWGRGTLNMQTNIRGAGRLLWSEVAQLDAASGFAASPVGLSGFAVCGTFLIAGGDIDAALLRECREVRAPAAQSRAGITRVPDVLIARYLGGSTEEVFHWFTNLWTVLRPALSEKTACPPRVWAC